MARWRFPLTSGPPIAAAGGIALMLIVGLAMGQDYNYDLENYHLASAHLLLTGGLERNIAPSGVQSWFNPIGYVPVTLAITALPPRLVSILLAIAAGLNAPLIYGLADRIAEGLPDAERKRVAFAATLIGMSGAITMSEAATSFLDNILSIAVLGALLFAIDGMDRADGRARRLGWAGLLLGLASGLKLTVVVFAVAMTAALLLSVARRRIAPAGLIVFAAGGLLGFAATGGWWAWHLWHILGNPIFPMANELFHSPWAPARALNDTTYQPKSWTALFADPWHWLIGDRTPGAEIAIRDPRYAIALVAALVSLPLEWRTRRAGDAAMLVGIFLLLSYLIWLFLFGILRYAVVIEMLSGLMVLAALRGLPSIAPKQTAMAMFVVALLAIAWTRTDNWGRAAFSGDWFGVRGIEAVHRPGTLYVMPDDAPLGFMAGLFPADARFVHIGGNFPLDPAEGLGARAAAMIRDAPAVRTLSASPDGSAGIAALRRFGLVAVPGSCQPIRTKVAPAESCLLAPAR